jgi:hypothetical protein
MSNSKKLNKKTDKDQHNNRKKISITKEDFERYKQFCYEQNKLEKELEEIKLKKMKVRALELDLLLEKKRLERELKNGKRSRSRRRARPSFEEIISDF